MTPLDVQQYTSQQVTVRQAVDQAQTAWARLDVTDLEQSWEADVRPQVVTAVEQAQAQTAGLAQAYVLGTLAAAAAVSAPLGLLVAGAFAGMAANGLLLAPLLDFAVGYLRRALDLGAPPSEARTIGLHRLLTYVSTEVADTGRLAVQVAAIVEPEIAGYERTVVLPACGRCVILSGRLYRYSQGFLRHPRCDCGMRPVTHDQWGTGPDSAAPGTLFERMTRAQQAKAFGVDAAEAIRAGADMSRVVNARRKGAVYTAGGYEFTHEATTKRGVGRQLGDLSKRPGSRYSRSRANRPTPAQLVNATDDRAELVHQLKRFGYIR
ncbi:hypothetical protein [Umezawaea sp. Da 62-37]|uniref:hypothetical protein n=1 Tax=Umezawaea sp. Da 62-37 TaxID=3075927 RepID=UPI0028F6C8E1|nr:hypothetical protein [Umezawaea sp. Da 62-37]WNV82221.1 hypothetical protein RM788_28885 [Umezawaea sp. Da 62-37]